MIAAIYARKSTEQNGVADEAKSVTRQVDHATCPFRLTHPSVREDLSLPFNHPVLPEEPRAVGGRRRAERRARARGGVRTVVWGVSGQAERARRDRIRRWAGRSTRSASPSPERPDLLPLSLERAPGVRPPARRRDGGRSTGRPRRSGRSSRTSGHDARLGHWTQLRGRPGCR
jgi:hypothetical protein